MILFREREHVTLLPTTLGNSDFQARAILEMFLVITAGDCYWGVVGKERPAVHWTASQRRVTWPA